MNTLFINMPFGAIRPAIGVSLLKGHLAKIGVSSRVLYFNMQFAHALGASDYDYIAERAPSQSLAGDWVFSRSAFGPHDEADRQYLKDFRDRFGRLPSTRSGIAALERSRSMAEPFIEDCIRQIDWSTYDIIGFTSTFTQQTASLALARRVKELSPNSFIVFGGANCESEMGLELHRCFTFIDFVCSGEADISFPKLVTALIEGTDKDDIPGVISRRETGSRYSTLTPERVQDMNALPYPDYGDYFEQFSSLGAAYPSPSPVLIESSRGCWWGEKHHCTFCGLNGSSMAYRSKRADRVFAEIIELCSRYGTTQVEMVDNILDMHYFHDLIPELKKRKLKLGLFYETKANLTKDHVSALYDAGVSAIQPGIESFSTEILRIMRKGTTAIQNVQLLKWCREAGVRVMWNFIYGFPGENPEDYAEIAKLVDFICHFQPPFGFGAIRLDRFSPNFVSATELGISNVRPDRSYRCIYDLPDENLFGLAYYFEHDYVDGREPQKYVGEAFAAMKRWQAEPQERSLVYADHGEVLAIWDFRSQAKRTLTLLKGIERDVYLYCDQNRSLAQINALIAQRDGAHVAVEPFLQRLILDRFIVQLDGKYLSLAIRADGAWSRNKRQVSVSRAPEHVVF